MGFQIEKKEPLSSAITNQIWKKLTKDEESK